MLAISLKAFVKSLEVKPLPLGLGLDASILIDFTLLWVPLIMASTALPCAISGFKSPSISILFSIKSSTIATFGFLNVTQLTSLAKAEPSLIVFLVSIRASGTIFIFCTSALTGFTLFTAKLAWNGSRSLITICDCFKEALALNNERPIPLEPAPISTKAFSVSSPFLAFNILFTPTPT
ncbi:MAG: hypothetical protein ACD_20C00330G0020 [uncultured bacterium]|nr:MAG: hypothetical protein ACD_20C00330G0020 [uncultured bacterium]